MESNSEIANTQSTQTLVFCWGLGKEGQCGNGSAENQPVPVKANIPGKVVSISAGGQFSAAVTSPGKLYMWGSNKRSQLGNSNTGTDILIPKEVSFNTTVVEVACGDWHTIIRDSMGRCYGTGFNKNGNLGTNDTMNKSSFVLIDAISDVRTISAGRNISLFINNQNKLFSAGISFLHGNSSKNDVLVPTSIESLEDKSIQQCSAGFSNCGCATTDGVAYTWGNGADFQLGHGTTSNFKIPKVVEALKDRKIVYVSSARGDKHTHMGAVDDDGQVWTWGSAYKGKLGHGKTWTHGTPKEQKNPKVIEALKSQVKIKKFISGGIHSAALSEDGILYTFGCGSDGRLGHPELGTHKYLYKEPLPKAIESLKPMKVVDAFSSYYHMIALVQK